MGIEQLIPLLGNGIPQAIFVALFIYLFTETRKDSAAREARLMAMLERAQEHETKETAALQNIAGTLANIERRMERIEGVRIAVS